MKKAIAILLTALLLVTSVTVYADSYIDYILKEFTTLPGEVNTSHLNVTPVPYITAAPGANNYEDQILNQDVAAYVGDAIVGRNVRISSKGVGVRSGPGTNYDEIGKLHGGATVNVREVKQIGNGTWYKIKYNDGYGWISAGYVVLHR